MRALVLASLLALAAGPLPGGELSFARAAAMALREAAELRLLRSAVRSGTLALKGARARMGPELAFSASGSYMTNPPEGITVTAGELGTISIPMPPLPPLTVSIPEEDLVFVEDAEPFYFELKLELRQPLFTWLKIRSGAELAALELQDSRAELEQGRREVWQAVHAAYFAAVLSRDSLPLLRRMVGAASALEAEQRRAFQLGAVNRKVLLEAAARTEALRTQAAAAGEALATACHLLAFYTGAPARPEELSSRWRGVQPGPEEEALKRSAASSSPALDRARLRLEQARADLVRLRGGAAPRPDLFLNLALDLTGQGLPGGQAGWQERWTSNLVLSLAARGTLFDSGRSRQEVLRAEEDVRSAQTALELERSRLFLEIRRSVQEVRARAAEVASHRAQREAAAEAQRVARKSFEQQLITRAELGAVELERLKADVGLLQAGYRYETALGRLEAQAGLAPAPP